MTSKRKSVKLAEGQQLFSMEKLNDFDYYIHKEMSNMTRKEVNVTADFWFFAIIKIDGYFRYRKKDEFLDFKDGTYAIVYPPWSLTEISGVFNHCELRIFISKCDNPSNINSPGIIPLPSDSFHCSLSELKRIMKDLNLLNIEINENPSYLVTCIKKEIELTYNKNIKLSKIADQLGLSTAHLSVSFKRGFGVSPSEYIHQLRVISSLLELLDIKEQNKRIADVAYEVGYEDVSRFNKQFKKRTKINPGKLK